MNSHLVTEAEAFALPYYREPHRAYHNEAHIRAMLAALVVRNALTSALALAVWGHDLIYDPHRSDNEERSAMCFAGWLATAGADEALCDEVRRLILATRHTSEPTCAAEALIVDADLSVLGAADGVFDAYDAAIRKEYSYVPEDAYRMGRTRILQAFLARPRIFTTPEFAALEKPARSNLTRAIARLTGEDPVERLERP